MIYRFLIFLVLNFLALGLGSLATSEGVVSDWYIDLNKAPWTPPGWFFGFAWSTIMICFAVFMATIWGKVSDKKEIITLYAIQWVLNVSWNPLFFHLHFVTVSLIGISLLTALVGLLMFKYSKLIKVKSLLIAPYFLWLIVATSLNAYIITFN